MTHSKPCLENQKRHQHVTRRILTVNDHCLVDSSWVWFGYAIVVEPVLCLAGGIGCQGIDPETTPGLFELLDESRGSQDV